MINPPFSSRSSFRFRAARYACCAVMVAAYLMGTWATRSALAEPSALEASAKGPLVVVVHAPPPLLDSTALRKAIASERGAVTIAPNDPGAASARATLTVALLSDGRELAVSYAEPHKTSISRVVTAPDAHEERI